MGMCAGNGKGEGADFTPAPNQRQQGFIAQHFGKLDKKRLRHQFEFLFGPALHRNIQFMRMRIEMLDKKRGTPGRRLFQNQPPQAFSVIAAPATGNDS